MQLLDVNLLIALCDADHEHHAVARNWFNANSANGWATCPLTENAVLRILGQPAYPNGLGSPEAVRPMVRHLCSLPGHQFWPDAISLTNERLIPSLTGASSKMLTDLYLLALAVHREGRFITMDTRINPALVRAGRNALVVIDT